MVVESLDIQIESSAKVANDAIDRLVGKLDRLSASLGRLNTSNLNTLAIGVNRLGTAMQTMNGVKTADFTRLAKNLERLNLIDVSNLSSISASVNHMATAFNQLGNVSENALSIGEMAKNIAKLGNKSVQTAITNIPQLAVAMRDLLTTLSAAPNVSRNIIDMTNALANLANQGSRVGSASRSIVRGMNNTTSSMNRARKSTTSLAAAFGKFYATWFLAIRGAKGLVNAIESTTDYLEAFNFYDTAFTKVGNESADEFEKYGKELGYATADEYADSFESRMNENLRKLSGLKLEQFGEGRGLLTESGMKNLGLNIQEVTTYAAQLASVMNSIGQTSEVTLAASKAFTNLAGDISSLFNIDYSSAANNIQSVLMGQSRAGYKFGWDTTVATLQKYADEFDLSKPVSEMSQVEKQQLRMIAILDQSRVSWGNLADTIESPANMMRLFKNNLAETGMVLGQLFAPLLQKVLPLINGVTIAIKNLLVSIASLLGIELRIDEAPQLANDAAEGFDDMADSLDGVASSAKKAKAGLRAFDELKVINMPETSGGAGGVGGGAIDLTDEILKATSEYEKVWQEAYDRMANKAQEIADRISKTLEPVRKIFEDFAVGDFFQAGEDTSHLVASILDFFAKAIDKVDWYGIGEDIGDFLAGIDWISVFKSAGKLMWQGLKAAFELFIGMFDAAPLETAVISLATLPKILKIITGTKIVKGVSNLSASFGDIVKALRTGGWSSALSTLRSNLTPLQKFSIGALGTAAEFALVRSGFEEIAAGSDNLVISLGKIAGGVGIATASLKLIGLSNPFTALIVGVTSFIAAVDGATNAAQKAREVFAEQKDLELFGESVSSLTERLNESAQATIEKANASLEYVKNAGIAETQLAKDLADRYFDLAEQESLTNEQTQEMHSLAEKLVEIEPSLNQFYDDRTGLLNANRDAINEIIDAKFKEIQLNAIEEQLTEQYKERVNVLGALKEATEDAAEAQKYIGGLQNQYDSILKQRDAAIAYEEVANLLSVGVDNLKGIADAQELVNELTKLGLDPTQELADLYQQLKDLSGGIEYTKIRGLNEELSEIQYELDSYASHYQDVMNSFSQNQEAYNKVEDTISELSSMMYEGMQGAGNDFDDGYADGILENAKKVEDAAKALGEGSEIGLRNAIESHSPSKVTMEIGKDFVEGYNLGILENKEKTKNIVSRYMEEVTKKFSSYQPAFITIGQQIISGLKDGMSGMESSLYSKVNSIADNVTKTIQKALDIHSPSKVMFELGDYTMQGYKLGMENLYQPIVSSMKKFGKDIRLAPAPTIDSMYGNLGYDQISSYTSRNYEPIYKVNGGYNQNNSETNSLLRQVIAELRKGHIVTIDSKTVSDEVRNYANEYQWAYGEPYFNI